MTGRLPQDMRIAAYTLRDDSIELELVGANGLRQHIRLAGSDFDLLASTFEGRRVDRQRCRRDAVNIASSVIGRDAELDELLATASAIEAYIANGAGPSGAASSPPRPSAPRPVG